MTIESWADFDEETARQVELWRAHLGLWRLEVLSTRCAWQLWPTPATRLAYVQALAEREKCEATVLALEGQDGQHASWRRAAEPD